MGGDLMSEEDYAFLGGRKECWADLPVAEKNACEIHNGLAFIESDPMLFVKRIWTREAQTFNPSSFFLRNLRLGQYEGLPRWLESALSGWVLLAHFFIVVTAALGAATVLGTKDRSRGGGVPVAEGGTERAALQATVWGLTLYHLAASGALIGLSRFRVPLLPLWIPFSALVVCCPVRSLRRAYGSVGRGVLATALVVLVMALSLTYLGRAFVPPA